MFALKLPDMPPLTVYLFDTEEDARLAMNFCAQHLDIDVLAYSIVKLETEHDQAPALSAQAKAEGKEAARKLMQSLRPNNKA
jgi:hypothetical protein